MAKESVPISGTSFIFELTNKLIKEGKSIIKLNVGEPDVPVPQIVKDALTEAVNNNETHYTTSQGYEPLRNEIARYYETNFLTTIDPDNIIVTAGVKMGINFVLTALIQPGDEVLIGIPCYPAYGDIIRYCNGIVKEIKLTFTNEDFIILEQKITNDTKVFILNAPNNPTSASISDLYLEKMSVFLQKYINLKIIIDEIYLELTYSGQMNSFSKYVPYDSRLIILSGFSKAWSMTGFRLGYIITPHWLKKRLLQLTLNSINCVSIFIQIAGIQALREREHIIKARKLYNTRANFVIKLLSNSDNIRLYCKPESSFYVFFEVKNGNKNLALDLLDKTNVALVPGSAFGTGFDKFLRLSFVQNENLLNTALNRIIGFIDQLTE